MKQNKRYFVVPLNGDDLNPILGKNFEEINFHNQITIVAQQSSVQISAWELTLEQIILLQTYLRTESFNIKLNVAIQINDGDIRWASPEQYDPSKKHKKKVEKAAAVAVSKNPATKRRRRRGQAAFFTTDTSVKKKSDTSLQPELKFDS